MFAPPMRPRAADSDVAALAELLRGKKVCVLTGAGCSTESGIPDYRSDAQRERVRRPIQHQEFVKRAETRARYWARSLLGWPRFAAFQPNACHLSLARLERSGLLSSVLTQNVDRLHHKAGSAEVLELHGALERVRCLGCGVVLHRDRFQEWLHALNPGFAEAFLPELLPDGDAHLPPEVEKTFRVPDCEACGDGMLKPDVVFFGDNVPAALVQEAFARVEASDVLLVAGSSLFVYSGYRFVVRAAERGIPVAIVNAGETRGDAQAALKLDALVTDVLPRVESILLGDGAVSAESDPA